MPNFHIIPDGNHAIVVNIKHSMHERASIKEAAASAWWFRGEKQRAQLKEARYVIAAAGNHVLGVFENIDATVQGDDSDRVEFVLGACAPLAALVGHLLPAPVRWKQGDSAAWKLLDVETLQDFLDETRERVKQFGPYSLKLTREGNLQVVVPAGFNIEVLSAATQMSAKQRIEQAVKNLANTEYVTTYGTLAEALGINSPQAVARSICRNTRITKSEGARVFYNSYLDERGALVPDDNISSSEDNPATRPELLAAEGIATLEGGAAIVSAGSILLDPIDLRLALNI